MNKHILVIGSSNTDMILKVPRIPKPGETIMGGTFNTAPGGKGANQAVAASRLGGFVSLIASIGDDVYGNEAMDGFISDHIDVKYIVHKTNTRSGVAQILVDDDGTNSIAVAAGANAKLLPDDIHKANKLFSSVSILLLQLEIPIETVCAAISLAAPRGIKIILNPAPAQLLPENILSHVSILTPNQFEAELFTGIRVVNNDSAARAGDVLLNKGIDTVLITMGATGTYIKTSSLSTLVPAVNVNAVDTTAAGDVFNGALAVALSENHSLTDAVGFANAAAALSVTRFGAQPSIPFRNQVDGFINHIQQGVNNGKTTK